MSESLGGQSVLGTVVMTTQQVWQDKTLRWLTVGVTAVAGTAVICYSCPGIIFKNMANYQRRQAGFTCRKVKVDDDFVMSYSERGRPRKGVPSMVMLHGMSGSKDAAVLPSRYISPEDHVIAVDLPAHGGSSDGDDEDLHLVGMSVRLRQLVRQLGLDIEGFHLIGWATGGAVAACYAVNFSEDLKLLTLTCPTMKSPVLTSATDDLVAGKNVVLPETPEGLQKLYDILTYKRVRLPQLYKRFFIKQRSPHLDAQKKVVRYMVEDLFPEAGEDTCMVGRLDEIKVPTQVIWGEQDKLLHVSGADVLRSKLGSWCKSVHIIPKCGHSIFREQPWSLGGLINSFRINQSTGLYMNERRPWAHKI